MPTDKAMVMTRAACWAFAEACFELEPNRVYARLLAEPAFGLLVAAVAAELEAAPCRH